jgi:hypothetical protein
MLRRVVGSYPRQPSRGDRPPAGLDWDRWLGPAPERPYNFDVQQFRRPAAEALDHWVHGGGVLFASSGAASRHQFDRPMDLLERTFGARCLDLQTKEIAGRPKYELRALKPLDHLRAVHEKVASLDQLCHQERLEILPGAEVILTGSQGRPAGTLNRAERGTAIRLAALPAVSYAHEAIRPPYE